MVYSVEMEGAGTVEIQGTPPEARQPNKFFTDVKNLIELNVINVDEEGNADIEGRIEDWEMRFNGDTIAGKSMTSSGVETPIVERMKQPFRMRISKYGEMLGFEGELVERDLFPFNAVGEKRGWTAALPPHPVKVGDTWAEDLPPFFQPVDENTKPQIHYSLAGFETIKGLECAVIETWMDESDIRPGESDFSIPGFSGMISKFSSFTQSMEGKLYFAHQAGVLIGFEFAMSQAGDMEISFSADSEPMKMKLNLEINGVVNLE
ncbi:MAG: hypothetical protein ABIH66_10725 [bacterium]